MKPRLTARRRLPLPARLQLDSRVSIPRRSKVARQIAPGRQPRLACELKIRQYAPRDFRALKAIWKSGAILLDETDTAEAIQRNLSCGGYRVFVAEAQMIDARRRLAIGKPRLAGGVVTTFDGHRAYVYHFAVHPDFRHMGLGRALLETCEQQARFWGARRLRLTARVDGARADARRVYAATGWVRDDSICTFDKKLD